MARRDAPALPVEERREAILQALAAGRSLVLSAETGSGKTTAVPRMLLEAQVARGRIVVLQPRRLATRAAARRVAETMGEEVGGRVGFRTRHESRDGRQTQLLFVTDGLFARMAQDDPTLGGIGLVMVDEFHERSLSSDLAVGFVRHLQATSRPDLRLVLASATIDTMAIATELGAAVVSSTGRLHPVVLEYQPPPREDEPLWRHAARVAASAARRGEAGDILVFLPGKGEIDRCIATLRADPAITEAGCTVLPLHGSLSGAEQDEAIREGPGRRIVVATNVAETSLTIPGVTLVIDSGHVRMHRYDPHRGLNALRLEPASQASAAQRAGRAGRVRPGRCIRLWSERAHARREAATPPEVERVDLAECVLLLASLGWRDAASFPWVSPPPPERLASARRVLRSLDAIDDAGAITPLGGELAQVPAHPRLARFLHGAHALGVAGRASLWAAIVAERDPAERVRREALAEMLHHGDPLGDLSARERLVEAASRGAAVPEGTDRGACADIARAAALLARAVRRAASDDPWPTAEPEHRRLVRALLPAFPDRIGWRQDAHRPQVSLEGLRAAELRPDSLASAAGPLIALDVGDRTDGRRTVATLGLAEGVPEELLRACCASRFSLHAGLAWDAERQLVVHSEQELFDGTPFRERLRDVREGDVPAEASAILAEQVLAGTVRLERWDERVDGWIARVTCVAGWFPERRLATYTDEERTVLLRELCDGAFRASQVRDREVLELVQSALSWDDREFVARMAPAEVPLPSGRRLRITYEPGQPPRGRGRIQDFYGLDETPRVAGGRVPVLLELTGPNQRPLQVTADLGNFWRVLYPQLRPELKRRYPKHEWR